MRPFLTRLFSKDKVQAMVTRPPQLSMAHRARPAGEVDDVARRALGRFTGDRPDRLVLRNVAWRGERAAPCAPARVSRCARDGQPRTIADDRCPGGWWRSWPGTSYNAGPWTPGMGACEFMLQKRGAARFPGQIRESANCGQPIRPQRVTFCTSSRPFDFRGRTPWAQSGIADKKIADLNVKRIYCSPSRRSRLSDLSASVEQKQSL